MPRYLKQAAPASQRANRELSDRVRDILADIEQNRDEAVRRYARELDGWVEPHFRVPDAEIGWRDVWLGGCITAVLFTMGKTAIGFYLGQASVGSAYGAAGSLFVLLVWVYYSALIMFFGAEFTHVWATRHHEVTPEPHAMPGAAPQTKSEAADDPTSGR